MISQIWDTSIIREFGFAEIYLFTYADDFTNLGYVAEIYLLYQ